MKIKQIALSLILALACLFFVGCSSYVSVYTTSVTNGVYTCSVDLFVSASDRRSLEANSEGSVYNYLSKLSIECGVSDSVQITRDGDGNLYLTLSVSVDSSDLVRDDYKVELEYGLFFIKKKVSFKNPLDRFKNAINNGLDNKPSKGTDLYLAYVILNGGNSVKSFSDYFNVTEIANTLVMNFLLKTRTLYSSDAQTEFVLNSKYFKWSSTLGEDGGYITYTEMGIQTWPWFVLAGIVGVVVVVVIFLIARKSKAKPSLKDCTVIENKRALSKIVLPGTNIRSIKTSEIKPEEKPKSDEVFEDETKTDETDKDKGD